MMTNVLQQILKVIFILFVCPSIIQITFKIVSVLQDFSYQGILKLVQMKSVKKLLMFKACPVLWKINDLGIIKPFSIITITFIKSAKGMRIGIILWDVFLYFILMW